MAYCIADLRNGHVKMVQAGHPHPLIMRRDGSTEFVGEGGVPIGLIPDIPFSQVDVYLEPGDRMLLYSDGITEARLENGEMLESEGLLELVERCHQSGSGQEFLDDLYWNLTQVMPKEENMDDDVSALLFEFNGP
jgi:sigma-B regulation protein RsbU (phosphoserine phosphatase)